MPSAVRPVFLPNTKGPDLVKAHMVRFEWFPGFSREQRQRSIAALHAQAKRQLSEGTQILEISTKSESETGRALSAFRLPYRGDHRNGRSVEAVYQSAKIFESAGPFPELADRHPKEIRSEIAKYAHQDLIGFELDGNRWPLRPTTAFYDWIYISSLRCQPHLADRILMMDGFTDIEFNPARSSACQASATARFCALSKMGCLDGALSDKTSFMQLAYPGSTTAEPKQISLL